MASLPPDQPGSPTPASAEVGAASDAPAASSSSVLATVTRPLASTASTLASLARAAVATPGAVARSARSLVLLTRPVVLLLLALRRRGAKSAHTMTSADANISSAARVRKRDLMRLFAHLSWNYPHALAALLSRSKTLLLSPAAVAAAGAVTDAASTPAASAATPEAEAEREAVLLLAPALATLFRFLWEARPTAAGLTALAALAPTTHNNNSSSSNSSSSSGCALAERLRRAQ